MYKVVSFLIVAVLFGAWTHGGGGFINSASNLGMNLSAINYFSPELPFVNIFKTSTQYSTKNNSGETSEEACLELDSNGYVTSFTALTSTACTGSTTPAFTNLYFLINSSLQSPYYPAGNYDVYYNPNGCNFTYGNDASVVSQNMSAGHDVFNVATPVNGITMRLTAIGSGSNYCGATGNALDGGVGVKVTLASLTAGYLAGCGAAEYGPGCYNPSLISYLAPFRAIRFMDEMCTNDNTDTADATWATRPLPTTIFYGSSYSQNSETGAPIPCGVPVEVMVALCNVGNFDCWFNMPTLTNNTYVTNFANYVAAHLNSNLYAYVEYSNETWNTGFLAWHQLTENIGAGNAAYAQDNNNGCGNSGSLNCNRSVMGEVTKTFCGLWKTAWGGASNRVKCVLGAQAGDGNGSSASSAISCPEYVGDNSISSGTYNSATGAVSLTTATAHGLTSGSNFSVYYTSGTGSWAGLNSGSSTFTAGAGTSGTTINYTAATGVGTSAITGGGIGYQNCKGLVDYVAIAPYFGNCDAGTSASPNVPNAWLSPEATGLTDFFTAVNTSTSGVGNCGLSANRAWLNDPATWEVTYQSITSTYGLPIIAYESGQQFSSASYDSGTLTCAEGGGFTCFFSDANLDSRMGTAYTSYYNTWTSNGGQLMMVFSSITTYDKFGFYGQVPSLCGVSCSAPDYTSFPKFSASSAYSLIPCTWTTAESQPCKH